MENTTPVPAEKKYEQNEGDVTIFKNATPKEGESYQFFGKAVMPGGNAKILRLWRAASAKTGAEYFKGYALDKAGDFKGLTEPSDDKNPGYVVIFHNEGFDETAIKRRPIYSGKISQGEHKFKISLWNKQGAKGEFYSGRIENEQQSEGTESAGV